MPVDEDRCWSESQDHPLPTDDGNLIIEVGVLFTYLERHRSLFILY